MYRQEFDAEYLQQLIGGDRAIEEHFTAYFQSLIRVKLFRRGWSGHDIEDMCQETFLRVLQKLRKDGIDHPERIGGYVVSVCNNVVHEMIRTHQRHPSVDATGSEPPDTALNMEDVLIDDERKRLVLRVLQQMPAKQASILRMMLEGVDRGEICERTKVKRENLRVILHRALIRFKELADRTSAASAG